MRGASVRNARQGQGTPAGEYLIAIWSFGKTALPLGDGGQWVIRLYGGGGPGGEADPL